MVGQGQAQVVIGARYGPLFLPFQNLGFDSLSMRNNFDQHCVQAKEEGVLY